MLAKIVFVEIVFVFFCILLKESSQGSFQMCIVGLLPMKRQEMFSQIPSDKKKMQNHRLHD